MPAGRPLALGYQSLRLDSAENAQEAGQRILAAYAEREGYALGAVYTDRTYIGRLPAFETLLSAAARQGAAAVIVPYVEDLGRMPQVRQAMQRRLEQVAGVRVLVANR